MVVSKKDFTMIESYVITGCTNLEIACNCQGYTLADLTEKQLKDLNKRLAQQKALLLQTAYNSDSPAIQKWVLDNTFIQDKPAQKENEVTLTIKMKDKELYG